ncbi:MAG: c-type cytochrome [Telluria sp.]
MSDAHEHHSPIRTPGQLAAAVAAFFLVVVIGIILLVSFVTTGPGDSAGTESQSAEAIAARLRPVADEGYTLKDVNAPKVLLAGDAVYTANCAACHTSGAAGAPKLGDAAGWGARLAQSYDTLVKHAIEGIRAMPAKGGNPELDDVEVARAVVFMANKGGASFKEPAVPAPAAPAAAAPAALSADAGKNIYNASCAACHTSGIAGAPKFADKAAWAARIKQGDAVLYDHAIKGFTGKAGMMPPKGGSTASDAEVKAAVDYMVAAAK